MFLILKEELKQHALKAFSACLIWFIISYNTLMSGRSDFILDQQGFFLLSFTISGLLLGLIQGYSDWNLKVRLFIWHRPIKSTHIFLGKILAGILLYAVISGIPFLLYVLYYNTIYPKIYPFTWHQIHPNIIDFFIGLNSYFVGVIIMIRNAKWTRSRVVPVLFVFLSYVTFIKAQKSEEAILYVLILCVISYHALKFIYILPKQESSRNKIEEFCYNLFLLSSLSILLFFPTIIFHNSYNINKSSSFRTTPSTERHFTKESGLIKSLHKPAQETSYHYLSGERIFNNSFTYLEDIRFNATIYRQTEYYDHFLAPNFREKEYYIRDICYEYHNSTMDGIWSLSNKEKKIYGFSYDPLNRKSQLIDVIDAKEFIPNQKLISRP